MSEEYKHILVIILLLSEMRFTQKQI